MSRRISPPARFSVGVNYWTRSGAMKMWRRFDPGEIRDDFAHIAALDLDTVRLFLRWDDFAPEPDRVDEEMLGRLEAVAGLAADAGLQTLPVLFCGHMGGANWLPAWALDRKNTSHEFSTIVNGAVSPFGAANLYSGPLLDAQLYVAREVGARLRLHPGVRAWDIGHAFSNVREPAHGKISSGDHGKEPAAEREVAQWSLRLTEALRTSSGLPVTAGTHSGDISVRDRDIRLASLCMPFAFASMQGSPAGASFARGPLDPEYVPFLAMLTAAFSFKPVLITGFGNPSLSEDEEGENAAYCSAVLERLHADGRLGAYWWCWSDDVPNEASCGIVRSDGTEKPVASVLARFAREQRTVLMPSEMPMISSTFYYRTLPASSRTLYEAFLGFVGERFGG